MKVFTPVTLVIYLLLHFSPGSFSQTVAISLDADKLYPFYKGLAVVEKGKLKGLINSKGLFVMEYGNYSFDNGQSHAAIFEEGQKAVYNRMLFRDIDKDQVGFIDHQEKAHYLEKMQSFIYFFNAEGNAVVLGRNDMLYVVDTLGRMKPLRKREILLEDNNDVNKDDYTRLYPHTDGYKKFATNKVVLPKLSGKQFHEGLAAVHATDKFGDKKWGFINEAGKLVIDYTFKYEPKPFSGGLAQVYPNDNAPYSRAFIDKNGEARFTVKENYDIKPFSGPFALVYADGGTTTLLLDTLGKLYTPKDILLQYNIPIPQDVSKFFIDENNEGRIYISASRLVENAGFIVIDAYAGTYQLLEGNDNVEEGFKDVNYDPVSTLRYFKKVIGNKENGAPVFREGYINEKEVFVLVKKEG